MDQGSSYAVYQKSLGESNIDKQINAQKSVRLRELNFL